MEDLVIALNQDGTLDTATGFAVNSDWWSMWYMTSTQSPAFTARVLGAWFDRQLQRADELNRDDPFSGSPELVTHSQFSEHIISRLRKKGKVLRRSGWNPNWFGDIRHGVPNIALLCRHMQ